MMQPTRSCSLYRFIRDENLRSKILEWSDKYGFGPINVLKGHNFYSLLNDVIDNCPDEYALISCNDLIWPMGLGFALDGATGGADREFGPEKWGVIGNCGIEYFSQKPLRYLRNVSSTVIPCSSAKPRPATFLDPNTLLLNISNLRRLGIRLPASLQGVHLHALALIMECYKKGLVSAVDSHLYVMDLAEFDHPQFRKEYSGAEFGNYVSQSFINKTIKTNHGPVNLSNTIDYLTDPRKDKRLDYYGLIDKVVQNTYIERPKKIVTVVTRTMLGRMNQLFRLLDSIRIAALCCGDRLVLKVVLAVNNADPQTREANIETLLSKYADLDISVSDSANDKQYPRVYAMKNALSLIRDDSSFVWFVDDDDFIYPEAIQHLPAFLSDDSIFIGDSAIFEEKWEEGKTFPVKSKRVGTYKTDQYHECIMGDNKIPVCSIIYPVAVIKQIFEKFRFLGDYTEDYALYLVASCSCEIVSIPMLIAGISFHGANTILEKDRTHWHHSYTAFISEIVEKKVIPSWVCRFAREKSSEIARLQAQIKEISNRQPHAAVIIPETSHPQPYQMPQKRWIGRRMEQSFRRFRKSAWRNIRVFIFGD